MTLLYITNFRKNLRSGFLSATSIDYVFLKLVYLHSHSTKQLSSQKVSEIFPVQLLQVPGAVLWLMHTLPFLFPMITTEISAQAAAG